MNHFIHSVLVEHLPEYLAIGWRDDLVRERKPSVAQSIAVIEWSGEGEPPLPESLERNE